MPSPVELLAVVGAVDVFHTTPLAEMVPPPAAMVFPPLAADEAVMEVIAVVETEAGATATPDVVGAEVVR